MAYSPSICDILIKQYTGALVILNNLQDKVPQEIEDAVGRLRDRFEFLPSELEKVLPSVEFKGKPFVREASENAVAVIDKLRGEMDRRGTTRVLKYTTSDPNQDLQVIINKLQVSILQEASENLSDCFCTSVCPTR